MREEGRLPEGQGACPLDGKEERPGLLHRVKRGFAVALCAVLAAAAAILLVMVRYSDIAVQYAVVNDYKTTIEENNRTLAELEVRLNSAVSLEEAREAALAAGLGYPAASQIVSIDGTGAGSWSSSQ